MLTALALVLAAEAGGPPPGGWPPPPASAKVKSVYDGDTVTLATGDKIRLRWVNTPELKPLEDFGVEAREAAVAFLGSQTVRLMLGSENPRDGYGRVVAGLQTDQGHLSQHLVELGLAHVFVIPPDDTDLTPMLKAQAEARAAKRGIWSTDRYAGALHITSFHANARGDDNENVNGEYLRVCNVTTEAVDLAGYTLSDEGNHSFTLPSLSVPAGHTVKLHSGKGEHQADPARQLQVFLGSDGPIWNNDGDTATLRDPAGAVVDERRSK